MAECVVIVGNGIFFAFPAPDIPRVADEYCFVNHMITDGGGKYRVREVDTLMHKEIAYPHILVDRIGKIPAGMQGIKIEATH